MKIFEKQQDIVEQFSIFDEWLDKYAFLIELGKSLTPYPEQSKNEQHLIQGCQSRVWIDAKFEDGVVHFIADSDAIITKGIVALLLQVYSGETPEAILESKLTFIEDIGLQQNLSPTRANGLVSMLKQIKMYALAFQTKSKG